MIRIPQRALARIITAREQGHDPDVEEAERRAAALRIAKTKERRRAETRLVLVAAVIGIAFSGVSLRMAGTTFSAPDGPAWLVSGEALRSARADIVDREGRVLATTIPAASVYVETRQMVDKLAVARGLAGIFPEHKAEELLARFEGRGNFHWIRKRISPEQRQAVHDLGEPGVFFGERVARVYPSGPEMGHILGGVHDERVSAHAAELKGIAGLELAFDDRLADPDQLGTPLALSIDLQLQTAMREVLQAERARLTAKGAVGVLMEAETGDVLSMVSLPDFDPNDRPDGRRGADAVLFNRAAQGVYELGSTFKPFAAALAIEEEVATPETMIDTGTPLRWGGFPIRDIHRMDPEMSLADVIVQSSNVGTARLAQATGTPAQQRFLGELGLLSPTSLELPEARTARPLLPPRWSELSTMTISYGHGISVSPLHLAAAYAPFANGGYMVEPTLVAGERGKTQRVMSEDTATDVLEMMRRVVAEEAGTANFAHVPGYEIAGKTGSADKPAPGGYDRTKVIATFAGVFPASDPRYVLVITLDEPTFVRGDLVKRTAGWTAAPASARMIRRLAPILDMRPITPTPNRGTPSSLILTAMEP